MGERCGFSGALAGRGPCAWSSTGRRKGDLVEAELVVGASGLGEEGMIWEGCLVELLAWMSMGNECWEEGNVICVM